MHVVVVVLVWLRVEEQLTKRQLPALRFGRRDVVEQGRIDPSGRRADDVGVRVHLVHPALDPAERLGAPGGGDLVELVHDDERRGAVAGGRGRVPVDGVEVGGGVEHVDDTPGPDTVDPAEPDDA